MNVIKSTLLKQEYRKNFILSFMCHHDIIFMDSKWFFLKSNFLIFIVMYFIYGSVFMMKNIEMKSIKTKILVVMGVTVAVFVLLVGLISIPVSYTHLDVYKRQPGYISALYSAVSAYLDLSYPHTSFSRKM